MDLAYKRASLKRAAAEVRIVELALLKRTIVEFSASKCSCRKLHFLENAMLIASAAVSNACPVEIGLVEYTFDEVC